MEIYNGGFSKSIRGYGRRDQNLQWRKYSVSASKLSPLWQLFQGNVQGSFKEETNAFQEAKVNSSKFLIDHVIMN